MSSLESSILQLKEVMNDPEKAEALLDLIMNSENEQVKKMVMNAWMTVILTMGEEIEEAFNAIDKQREYEKEKEKSKMKPLNYQSEFQRTLADLIKEEYNKIDYYDDDDDWLKDNI